MIRTSSTNISQLSFGGGRVLEFAVEKTARELSKTLKNNLRNWLIFTKETRKLSMTLLLFLLYLWLWTFIRYVGIIKVTTPKAFVDR